MKIYREIKIKRQKERFGLKLKRARKTETKLRDIKRATKTDIYRESEKDRQTNRILNILLG